MSERRLDNRSNLPFRQRTNNQYGSRCYRSLPSNAIRESNRSYSSSYDYNIGSNRSNTHSGIDSGSRRYSSHRECLIQVHNRNVTRINFPVHINTSNITDILQDLESDRIQSLTPGVAIALLHKIGKCRCDSKIKSFDIRKRVMIKIINSFPYKFSNVHIGNACYSIRNISKATINKTSLISALAVKISRSDAVLMLKLLVMLVMVCKV